MKIYFIYYKITIKLMETSRIKNKALPTIPQVTSTLKMSKNFDNTQKKALEKIYTKIFDTSSTN